MQTEHINARRGRLVPALAALALLAALSACAPAAQEPLTQCEPGLADIGRTTDLVPAGC